MFLRVRLPIGEAHPALLVPQAAIGSNQGQKFVRVVNAENMVEYRPIVAGQEAAGRNAGGDSGENCPRQKRHPASQPGRDKAKTA